ncbi:MAG: signal peptidase II [Bacteroidetes bacterium]|nr:signal peptidase II [Bacteroidota bacterium]
MRALRISVAVILVDQLTKIIVLLTMRREQSIDLLGNWLKFTYTENPGMAFGIEYGHPALITLFSIIATGMIVLYIRKVDTVYAPYYYSLSLVLGGALGNIIDRIFYSSIIYGGRLFTGRVVDFIHLNVWRGYVPEDFPVLGGKYVALFPIWNVADMAIVIGVVGILVFQRRFHERLTAITDNSDSTEESSAP